MCILWWCFHPLTLKEHYVSNFKIHLTPFYQLESNKVVCNDASHIKEPNAIYK
jgi:hypothetical protein